MSAADFQPMQRMTDDEINRLVAMSPQINTMAAANPSMLTRDGALTPGALESILGYGSGASTGMGGMTTPATGSPYAMWGITDPDEVAYLDAHPDVFAAMQTGQVVSPKAHYEQFGKAAGWTWGKPVATPAATPTTTATAVSAPASMYGNAPENWASFIDQGRAASAGINQMPWVFSDYGSIPADDKAANALFYQAPAAVPTGNPLLTGVRK